MCDIQRTRRLQTRCHSHSQHILRVTDTRTQTDIHTHAHTYTTTWIVSWTYSRADRDSKVPKLMASSANACRRSALRRREGPYGAVLVASSPPRRDPLPEDGLKRNVRYFGRPGKLPQDQARLPYSNTATFHARARRDVLRPAFSVLVAVDRRRSFPERMTVARPVRLEHANLLKVLPSFLPL